MAGGCGGLCGGMVCISAACTETMLKNVHSEHIMPPLCLYKNVIDETQGLVLRVSSKKQTNKQTSFLTASEIRPRKSSAHKSPYCCFYTLFFILCFKPGSPVSSHYAKLTGFLLQLHIGRTDMRLVSIPSSYPWQEKKVSLKH